MWLIEPFTGVLLNHRTVSLAPKQTQVSRRRHGEVDAPTDYPPPLRRAGCSAPGLQNQGRSCYGEAGQKTSLHLSDKPMHALRCPVCLTAVKSQDNFIDCRRCLAMGHCFSACVNQSSTVHVNHLLGDLPSGCVRFLSMLCVFTDIHCCIPLDP